MLPGWDVRTLTAHLVMAHATLLSALAAATSEPAVPIERYVQGYRPGAESIAARTAETAGDRSGPELVESLSATLDAVAARLAEPTLPAVVRGPRGPSRVEDFLASRIVEVVVHGDDLNRSLPESGAEPVLLRRGALARCSRTLAGILAVQHPGRSVEVRIPPYAAVQCAHRRPRPDPHPRHPAQRGRDRRRHLPPAGHRPYDLGRGHGHRPGPRLRPPRRPRRPCSLLLLSRLLDAG